MTISQLLTPATGGNHPDALDLLERDHTVVADLFDTYEDLESDNEKEALVSRIILELTIHGRVEEELFLPSLRQVTGDDEVVDEASVGHAIIRKLMADLHGARATERRYDAKVKALAELVKHHVEEEERRTFMEALDSELDLSAIGRQLEAYQSVLRSRYELDTNGEGLAAFLSITTRNRKTSIRRPANSATGRGSTRSRSRERHASVSARRVARKSGRVVAGDCYPRRSTEYTKEN